MLSIGRRRGTSPRRVNKLIASGRYLDAIQVLSERIRRSRNPRIEEQLVQLRRDAFSELDNSRGRRTWPPVFDDPFPSLRGPIEISRDELSVDALGGAIQHHGHVVVRGLISQRATDRLVGVIDRAFEAQEASQAGAPVSETSPWFAPAPRDPRYPSGAEQRHYLFARSRVLVADSPRALSEVTDLLREAGVYRLVREYLGEPPVVSEDKWALRRVDRTNNRAPWHQEASVFDAGPLRTINLWLTLSPCGVDAPGLEFFPRRMHSIIEPDLNFGLRPETVDRFLAGTAVAAPTYEPGDAVLFDEYLVHRTKADRAMSKVRYSIESWMFAPSGHPLKDRFAPFVL
jgi:ectoine hydroxylase-related dioxygenase (phytanoyl-CoA dioxygenase family)